MKKFNHLYLIFILVLCLCVSLCGCNQISLTVSANPYTADTSNKINTIDQKLFDYVESFYKEDNFVVSPLSLHYMMALTMLGANSETQKELLDFYGFSNINDFYGYATLATDYEKEFADKKGADFSIANGLWYNKDLIKNIKESYVNAVSEHFGGTVQGDHLEDLESSINNWVKEETNGSIESAVEDLSPETIFALINALYVKDSWKLSNDSNLAYYSGKDDFTAADGTVSAKEYATYEGICTYYKDETCELADIETENGLHVAFILGENNDVYDCISSAEQNQMKISFPRIDINTSLTGKELITFFNKNGELSAFNQGDFSNITKDNATISEICQKTCIQLSENGIEASTASSAIGTKSAATKLLTFNQPFRFYVYVNEGNGAYCTVFFGEVNK